MKRLQGKDFKELFHKSLQGLCCKRFGLFILSDGTRANISNQQRKKRPIH